jgi:hypothetical protein
VGQLSPCGSQTDRGQGMTDEPRGQNLQQSSRAHVQPSAHPS